MIISQNKTISRVDGTLYKNVLLWPRVTLHRWSTKVSLVVVLKTVTEA